MSADVTKQEDIDRIVAETLKAYGRIDILVSNAGMALPRCHTFDFTREDWRRIFDLNLDAGYFLAQACGREMAKTGGGRIVFMTSQRGISAMQNIAPYCITKGAVMAMIKALAIDLAPYQINVNGVAPGYVMTDMVSGLLADEARLKNVLDKTPLGKMGTTDEMAAARTTPFTDGTKPLPRTITFSSQAYSDMSFQALWLRSGLQPQRTLRSATGWW